MKRMRLYLLAAGLCSALFSACSKPIPPVETKPNRITAPIEDEEKEMTESNAGTKKWTCIECGAENSTAEFCENCGAPKSGFKFRPIEKWPEYGHIPTLKEVRSKETEHGELLGLRWYSSSSGMMIGSISQYSLSLMKDNGRYVLTEVSMPVYEPIVTRKYLASEEILEKIRAIVDKENLAAWSYLRVDQDKKLQIFDYSGSTSLTLIFDDTPYGGWKEAQYAINLEAAQQQGGDDVLLEIRDLMKEGCNDPARMIETKTEPNPYVKDLPISMGTTPLAPENDVKKPSGNGYVIAEDGSWTCPSCGAKGNTGRFCYECGSSGPGYGK